DKILELNSGTGIDAVFLSSQGISIYATDGSEKMISKLKEKIRINNLERIKADVIEFSQLNELPETGFDGIFSNFGGLNCINDFEDLSENLSLKLKPGGKFIAVVINRFCPWEISYYLMKFNPRNAFRRFVKNGIIVNLDGI